MTTIAATGKIIAADSLVVADSGCFQSPKLLRTDRGIIGAAGYVDIISKVFDWFDGKAKKPKIPARRYGDFVALILTESGLLYMESDLAPIPVLEGIYAIGSGSQFALGAMERDLELGIDPDPVAAVRVASRRDSMTSGEVSFLSWS